MKFLAQRALALLAWCPLLLMAAACANQAEGDRCDNKNGNADCAAGLICTSLQTRDSICCPPAPPVTAPACNLGGSPPPDAGSGGDGNADVESGGEASAPEAAPTNDAPSETTNDRGAVDTRDVASDRGPDAPPDIQPESAARDATDATDAPGDASDADATSDGATDGPLFDAPPDAAPDTADGPSEASPDAVPDASTPDAEDAVSADGSG